jgi:ATP-dependent DNA ligase
MIMEQSEDLRPVPLSARKAKLSSLLARKHAAIVFDEYTDEEGATVFRHACKLRAEPPFRPQTPDSGARVAGSI